MNSVILLAAGQSSRMLQTVEDKTLTVLNGIPVILYSIQAFQASDLFENFIIVYRDSAQKAKLEALLNNSRYRSLNTLFVRGGESRQASVHLGLSACPKSEFVAIHDSARPLISSEFITNLFTSAQKHGSAIPFAPITDTIKQVAQDDTDSKKTTLKTIERASLRALQTPQLFTYESIYQAYQNVTQANVIISDDSSALSHLNKKLYLVENPDPNPKITTKKDLDYILYLLKQNTAQ